jgi:hypothetical protein
LQAALVSAKTAYNADSWFRHWYIYIW